MRDTQLLHLFADEALEKYTELNGQNLILGYDPTLAPGGWILHKEPSEYSEWELRRLTVLKLCFPSARREQDSR